MTSRRSRGLSAIGSWFRQGPIIDGVYKSILDQKMNNIAWVGFLTEAKSNETIEDFSIIYQFIEREREDQFVVPADDVKDILKMLEDRRQGYIRNTTTILSGLIGGILGASLTFLLGSHATNVKPASPQPQLSEPSSTVPESQSK